MPGILNALLMGRSTTQSCTQISSLSSTGSNIGDMTSKGGLAAAFNGNTTESYSGGAEATSGTTCYIGKDWGSGVTKTICRIKITCPSTEGFTDNLSGTFSFLLQGSTTGSWTGEQVTLYTSGSYSAKTVSLVVDITSGITQTTAYRYHRVYFTLSVSDRKQIAELEMWELV